MNRDTPARLIGKKDLGCNRDAAVECMKLILPGVRSIIDIRYGLGGWARKALQIFEAATLLGFESDAETANEAWISERVILIQHRWTPGAFPRLGQKWDLLLADFNTATVRSRAELDEALEEIRPGHVIFTDVACGKLHLNFSSYGLETPSLRDYWRAFEVPGYRLLGYFKRHHAASTACWRRLGGGEGA